MKAALCLAFIGVFAIWVHAEYCSDTSPCSLTTCGNGTTLICHKHEHDQSICTCQVTAAHQCDHNDPDLCRLLGDCHGHGKHWKCRNDTCHCDDKFANGHDNGHNH